MTEKTCNSCIHFGACSKWTDFPKQCGVPVCASFAQQSEKYLIKENGDILPLTHHSEWISVDDRMPTECENVLCFEKGKMYVAFLENAEYSAVWWDWVDYDRDDTWTERTPTHWMPLPSAPKGE